MSAKASKGKGEAPPKRPAPERSLDFSALDLAALEEDAARNAGEPLRVHYSEVYEDTDNPRTEFPEAQIEALADDVEERGVLQPIVVWPRDERGYKIRYGAKRRRAAERAALRPTNHRSEKDTVPIAVYADPGLDDYAQVAENRERSNLSAMDLARFIRRKIEGEGRNAAEIARRLRMDKSAITHHLAMLKHPEPILAVYRSGRCTSAKTLWELGNLHREHPAEVEAFLSAETDEVTRASIRQLAARLNGQGGASEAAPASEGVGPVQHGGGNERGSQTGREGEGGRISTPADPNINALVSRMQDHYGTKVSLQHNAKTGRGSVTFKYFSLEEFQGLLAKWQFPSQSDE